MHNLVMPAPPPSMDSFAPKFCFCGEKTVESHEFWFCSTRCARLDSLRSLDNPDCHYRNVIYAAYVRAGVPDLYPRRTVSADRLLPAPPEQRGFANAPSRFPPPMNLSNQRNVTLARRDRNFAGFPTLSQVTGKVLTSKEKAGEPLVAARQERSKWEGFPNAASRVDPSQRPQDHTNGQVSLDPIPVPKRPPRSLKRVPPPQDGLKNNIQKSVAALLTVAKSRKGKDRENPKVVIGHPVNTIVPPVRNDSLPSHCQKNPTTAIPAQGSKALRRSASFAGWDTAAHGGPSNAHDTLMHIVEEMREEVSEDFNPRSLFDMEESY